MASSLYWIESQYIHEIREEEKVCNLNKVRGEDKYKTKQVCEATEGIPFFILKIGRKSFARIFGRM